MKTDAKATEDSAEPTDTVPEPLEPLEPIEPSITEPEKPEEPVPTEPLVPATKAEPLKPQEPSEPAKPSEPISMEPLPRDSTPVPVPEPAEPIPMEPIPTELPPVELPPVTEPVAPSKPEEPVSEPSQLVEIVSEPLKTEEPVVKAPVQTMPMEITPAEIMKEERVTPAYTPSVTPTEVVVPAQEETTNQIGKSAAVPPLQLPKEGHEAVTALGGLTSDAATTVVDSTAPVEVCIYIILFSLFYLYLINTNPSFRLENEH